MMAVPEYTAEIDRNLLNGGEWVIRVKYVRDTIGGKRKWARFVLVPNHQGEMFSRVCATIEPAIVAHQRDGGKAVRPGYSRV